MKFVRYISTPSANELHRDIANGLSAKGHELEYITESSVIYEYLHSGGIPVFDLTGSFKDAFGKFKKMALREKERMFRDEYGWTSLEFLTRGDAVLQNRPDEEKLTYALAYFDAWRNYFAKSKPDVIISSEAIELVNMTFIELGKHLDIPSMFSSGSSVFPKKMIWDKTIMINTWVNRELLKKKVGEDELSKMTEYVEHVTRTKPMVGFKPIRPFSKMALEKTMEYFIDTLVREDQHSKYFDPYESVKTGVIPLIRRPVSKGYYLEPGDSDKFLFFPFHVPFDSQVTFRAVEFKQQDQVAIKISRSLPENYFLYVKPHPHSVGHYPLKWFKDLAKVKNIKMIDPELSSHELIEKCAAVVTINSDVGWEALLHGKPVVVLASPFYSGLGYTFDVHDLDKLPEIINKALKQKPIPRSEIHKLVYAVFNSTVNGSFYREGWKFDSDESNVENIVNGIISSYERYYGGTGSDRD